MVINYFLNQRKQEYLNNKKSITYNQQSKSLTQLKQNDDTEWLKEVNSQSLQYSLKCLDQTYQNFFNKRIKFPNFKSKKSKNSFTCPQFVRNEDNLLFTPKFQEGIKNISDGTSDYERGAKINPKKLGTSNETLKKMEPSVPETTTSLV